jgi:2-amino-4-hydroxy-6-hydroxymethyldihydropteridine diphosphokinase
MHWAALGLGSNLGDRLSHLTAARRALQEAIPHQEARVSHLVESEPAEGVDGPPFLNAALAFLTPLSPESLLVKLQHIEAEAGRERRAASRARTLDLDLLFCGELVRHSQELLLPHPRMTVRWFVLEPLLELAIPFRHPLLNKTLPELARELELVQARETVITRRQIPFPL